MTYQRRDGGGVPVGATAPVTIVVFGAAVGPGGVPSNTLRRRVEAAAAFGACHVAPRFVVTGAVGRHGPSEASVMADLLAGFGVPAERIVLEETGHDTLSSVRACAGLLRGGGPVHVATSAYHLPRCVLLLRIAGVAARACPPPAVPAARRLSRRWRWRLREAAALPFDAVLALWLRATGRL
jgi:vancomycin permeability regulator SanA